MAALNAKPLFAISWTRDSGKAADGIFDINRGVHVHLATSVNDLKTNQIADLFETFVKNLRRRAAKEEEKNGNQQ